MANFCHACSQSVTQDMRACPHCGTALAATLPPQHHTVPQGAAHAAASAGYAHAGQQHPHGQPHASSHGASSHGASSHGAASYGAGAPGSHGPAGHAPAPGNPFSANSHLGAMFRPEARYRRASLGARFLAYVLDGIVSLGALIAGGVVLALGVEPGSSEFTTIGALLMFAGFLWAIFYSFAKDGFEGGASIGKRMMGLMVVHLPTNRPCTMGQSAIRALVMAALGMIPFVGFLVEPIAVLAGDGRRRLGDRAASTQVIATDDYTGDVA